MVYLMHLEEKKLTKEITIKLNPSQKEFVSAAITKFIDKCPMRFSEPSIKDDVLQIDPHDFLELIHYIDKNFENELEVQRLKKVAVDFQKSETPLMEL